ncbi:MAG: T9SS type A sorting domain-containing protein [Ignavibacteriaceae bacterium]
MDNLAPAIFYLGQNYPNPFKFKTTIKYCVAYKTKIRITIYNSCGKMINKLVDEVKEPGTYEIGFSISDFRKSRSPVSGIRNQVSGTYFYQMKAGDYLSEKEMTLIW